MELRYARPRTRRHGESPVGDWRRRFHGRLRGIASTAAKSPPPPSGFAMPPDTKSGLRRTQNFTKSTTRTVGRPLLIGNNYFETTSLCGGQPPAGLRTPRSRAAKRKSCSGCFQSQNSRVKNGDAPIFVRMYAYEHSTTNRRSLAAAFGGRKANRENNLPRR